MAKDQLQESLPTTATGQSTWMNVVIAKRETVATDIIALHLQSADGTPLPQFEAGAHVDVRIHSGLTRQYSLCTDPADKTSYRLAVLREPGSRGGSAAVHDQFQPGLQIRIGRPRNNFPLRDGAEHTILMAGGVGITPILSMAYALEARKASWELNYAVRSEDRLAFRKELAEFGNKVSTYLDNASQSEHRDIRNALCKPAQNRHLYLCGPNGFMDFIVQSARDAGWNDNCIHIERFGAEVDTDGVPFTLIAARSGKSTVVNPGESIAAKLRELDIEVPVSCQSGVCGTCLTPVLEGTPDHRDLVLTESEKAANDRITVCCSRSKTKTLVLDV